MKKLLGQPEPFGPKIFKIIRYFSFIYSYETGPTSNSKQSFPSELQDTSRSFTFFMMRRLTQSTDWGFNKSLNEPEIVVNRYMT